MADPKIKRETAKICPLKIILGGEYIVKEGWAPNYIKTKLGNISRINVIGMVVSKDSNQRFILDDGTATINMLNFDNKTSNLNVGDIILTISRVRKLNNNICLVSEIINKKQISKNMDWFKHRKNYLDMLLKKEINVQEDDFEKPPLVQQKETPPTIEFETPSAKVTDETKPEEIIDFIKTNDEGAGCSYQKVFEKFDEKIEDYLTELISRGELYEMKPGFLKVLE